MKYPLHYVEQWLRTAQNAASDLRARTIRITDTLRGRIRRHWPRDSSDIAPELRLSTWVRPVLGSGQHQGRWRKAAEPIVLVTALAWILALGVVGVSGLATFTLAFGLILLFLTQVFGISVDPIFRTPS